MGTVVQLKNQINDSYFQLKDSVEDKLVLTEEKIKDLVVKLRNDEEIPYERIPLKDQTIIDA